MTINSHISTSFLDGLRDLKQACGNANMNETAKALIDACIDVRADTRKEIIGLLQSVGLDPNHVAIVLKKSTGNDPKRHRWLLEDRRYRPHDPPPPS